MLFETDFIARHFIIYSKKINMKINLQFLSYILLSLFFLQFITPTFGQKAKFDSPYLISWKTDAPTLGVAFAGYIGGVINIMGVEDASDAEVLALNKDDLKLSVNRWTTEQDSEVADGFSDACLYASYAGAITLFASSKKIKSNILPPLVVFAESYLFVRAATFWTKSTAQRFRPYAYNPDIPLERRRKDSARTSFFSGHASTASVLCFTTAKMFADYYPNAKAKPYVWAGAAAIPLATGYLRMEAGRHFIGDVGLGYAVGAAFGILVPHFHKKAKEKALTRAKSNDTSLRVYPAEGGMLFSLTF